MFGYLIPESCKEALAFDKENNHTKLVDETRDEMDCIKEQEVFTKCQRAKWESNHKQILSAPPNHQKLKVNLIFTTPSGLKYSQHFPHVTFLLGRIPKLEKTT